MAHYAFLDGQNVVTEVIVGRDEDDSGIDWETHYAQVRGLPAGQCRRTSYNTRAGIHTQGGQPYRNTFAGVGYRFDPVAGADGAFYPPDPATL